MENKIAYLFKGRLKRFINICVAGMFFKILRLRLVGKRRHW